jgi:SAM-dependent methyltransferase
MKRCLVCEFVFEGETWKCPRCGNLPISRDDLLRFTEDPPATGAGFKTEYFSQLAGFEAQNFWFRARNELIQWALRKYFSNATSFFEVGCGTGFVIAGIQEKFPLLRIAGSEIFSAGLSFARTRLPTVQLYQMDALRIPFEREFDVLGAFDVLEHLPEDELALAQMFKAIRPGGGLMLTAPQHRFLWSASDEYARHQRRYRRAELLGKVENAGFQVERITSFISLLLPLMIWSRMQRRRDQNFRPWREFEMAPALNKTLETILKVERAIIKAGVSFPAGGSLLLVGRKSAAS